MPSVSLQSQKEELHNNMRPFYESLKLLGKYLDEIKSGVPEKSYEQLNDEYENIRRSVQQFHNTAYALACTEKRVNPIITG